MLFHSICCFKLDYAITENEHENLLIRRNPILVWISNNRNAPTKLRNNEKFKEHIPPYIDHLYYSEVDRKGKTLYHKWIYNLHDVVVLIRDRFGVKPSVYVEKSIRNPKVNLL